MKKPFRWCSVSYGLSVPVSGCKKYSQISDGLNAFGLSKVDLVEVCGLPWLRRDLAEAL